MNDKNDFSSLTKEEVTRLLESAMLGKNAIVMDPAVVAHLAASGVPFDVQAESIDEFFSKARTHCEATLPYLPPMPNWLEYQFQQPYYEARCALLIGLHGISITASAILLEHVLKWTAFCVDVTNYRTSNDDKWNQIEAETDFGKAIGYAKSMGLVDKALSIKLDRFREDVRNIQGHSKIYKATKDYAFHGTAVVDLRSQVIQDAQTLDATTNPTIAAIAKAKLDEKQALDVFLFLHDCMIHLFSKLDERITAVRQKSPTDEGELK